MGNRERPARSADDQHHMGANTREKEAGDDVEVRPEDQKAINSFGRLNNRKHDIEDEIKEKQSFHDLLDDASNEMILADEDEPVRHGFGECYFECNKDQAEELLDKQKEDTVKDIAVLNGELNGIHDTLSGLKTQLYGRFGSNINLEETPSA